MPTQTAYRTTDAETLRELSTHSSVGVRRNVARNRNTPREILENLSFDVTANVSVPASQQLNNDRKFEESVLSHPCIACDEYIYDKCKTCENLKNAYNKVEEPKKNRWFKI